MKTRLRGFAGIAIIIAVAALAIAGFTYYKLKSQPQTGGASIQTQLSDTIGTFRTNVNTNFTNIDSEIQAITSTQASYGTIVTANSPLPVANGGTGTTTAPSNTQFLSANSSTPAWKTLTFGAGLVSTTTATSVQLNTTGIDPTASYAWSGNNTHAGSETFNSSTLLATATSGVVVTSANGTVSAVQASAAGSQLVYNGSAWTATTSVSTFKKTINSFGTPAASTTLIDVATSVMPTVFNTNSTFIIDGAYNAPAGAIASSSLLLGGTQLFNANTPCGTSNSQWAMYYHIIVQFLNSTSSEYITTSLYGGNAINTAGGGGASNGSPACFNESPFSIAFTSSTLFQAQLRSSAGTDGATYLNIYEQ